MVAPYVAGARLLAWVSVQFRPEGSHNISNMSLGLYTPVWTRKFYNHVGEYFSRRTVAYMRAQQIV